MSERIKITASEAMILSMIANEDYSAYRCPNHGIFARSNAEVNNNCPYQPCNNTIGNGIECIQDPKKFLAENKPSKNEKSNKNKVR